MSLATSDVNYTDLLVQALTRYPGREAFVDGDRRLSYAQTAARISQFMQLFHARGLRPGATLAILTVNVPEAWMAQMAACLLGATFTGLHPLGSVDDHLHICDELAVDMLVVHPVYLERGLALGQRAASVRHILALGPSGDAEDLLALADPFPVRRLERRACGREDVHWVAYTGGTTGRSKGVEIPDRALVHQVQTVTTSLGLPENPRFLAVAPISHAGVLPIVPTLFRGGTVVFQRGFDPAKWLACVEAERINWSFIVPTMLYSLLDHGRPEDHDLSSLETIMYGSSPMSAARLAEAHEAMGPVFLQAYGQSECVSFATTLRKDEHDPLGNPQLLRSCGRPVLGMRVEVLGEDGRPVAAGEVGEICVRGPGIMKGYHRMPEETAQALKDGWLHSGDLATVDADGFVYIVDRKKEMIITGGFNVYSREIEDVIAELPEISAVAVIGVPDDKWGEAVKAVVVARPGEQVDPARLIELVRARKGAHQAPKTVDIVDRMPLTAVGKIDKKALRGRFWADQERMVH
ncbi:AMP-dependent synthetase and ligase [Rhizorhabdus wittichii RW1]|uniref:AMP-dependent synthetase and ligase n=1 Tax=Rhizorhabdus wittichii (strain DSM 6014 / CCUG 31198 / JCM 15750 / NBRC 105917 / EY 4224 / RW1) TaxID=392499 RepID=A0A9J9LDK8_RHIWR|nr:AMP-dependent synthetase and ligase [Rhizorhabdus wittichii RW1]